MVFLQTGLNLRKNDLDFRANLVVIFSNVGIFIQLTRWLGVSFLEKDTRVEKNFLQIFYNFSHLFYPDQLLLQLNDSFVLFFVFC